MTIRIALKALKKLHLAKIGFIIGLLIVNLVIKIINMF